MSLLDSEASEVSDFSEDENNIGKITERKRRISNDSSEDEEEDIADEEEICRKEGEGWIVDEEDVGDSGESDADSDDADLDGNSDDREEDDALDDDDFQLIQDNVGIDLKKKKKRLVVLDDDEADEDEKLPSKRATYDEDHNRDTVARQIFEDEEDDNLSAARGPSKAASFRVTGVDDEDEYDDMDDFIVDDGPNQQLAKPVRRVVHQDAALQEAQDIFGVDFDLSEFEAFRKGQVGGDVYSSESEAEYSDDEGVVRARRKSRRSRSHLALDDLAQVFDPSDMERSFYSQADERIRMTDCPERFQLRSVSVRCIDPQSPTYEHEIKELSDEAEWIYRHAFKDEPEFKQNSVVPKIMETLKLIKESLFEVPFIAFYRKECVERDLSIKDLWRIYHLDEKWTILQHRKCNLVRLLQSLMDFFDAKAPDDPACAQKKHVNSLLKLISCARSADSLNELLDVRLNYLLYYAPYVELMNQWMAHKKKQVMSEIDSKSELTQRALDAVTLEKAVPFTRTVDPVTGRTIRQRQARATASYEVAQRAGLSGLVQRFGLSAAQFAENVQDQYLRHDVDQCPMLPLDAASDFLCPQFPTPTKALSAARYMLAFQISREPYVRRMMRQMFQLQAVVSVKPTSRGEKDLDESHPLYPVRYLKAKPAADLNGSVLFLHLEKASREGLLTYTIHPPSEQIRGLSLIDELQRFFHQDEFSSLVQAWNEQRNLVLEQVANQFIFPTLVRELREQMLQTSSEAVLRLCAKKLFTNLAVAPYPPDGHRSYESDAEGVESPFGRPDLRTSSGHEGGANTHISGAVWSKGARVMALAIRDEDNSRQSVICAVHLDSNGEVVDFIHLHDLLQSKRAPDELKNKKVLDVQRLSTFMVKHRPQVVAIGCDCQRALILQEDVQRLIDDLSSERRLPRIHVELVETELSIVFARSTRASADLPASYNPLLRQSISLGRRLQDPLAEFAQLANVDNEILGLRWHLLQDILLREKLLQALEIEFINRVNEVGVDVNRCLNHPHTANLVQFISGLGPRKGLHMLKILKQNRAVLTNRMELVTMIGFGPRVVVNCAGFIKIDTGAVHDLGTYDIEILDSTRVHPESYDLAKKMAVDALEYEDTEECNPTTALKEIVESPARLRELDLDAFADELKRQDHGDKHITLYDIRKELTHRYRDYRVTYQSPNPESIFSMVTHETPETLHVGRLVDCRVLSVATRRPRPDQLDSANPTKNDQNGLWMCPFCRRDDFQQLNHVWSHFDNKECPGQTVGLRVQLDNGMTGFIPLRFIDSPVENLRERAVQNSMLQCRVLKIDITKFNVELTCKAADLKDERFMWHPRPDPFFDYEADEAASVAEAEAKAKAKSKIVPYFSRVIFHPYFKNISYDQLAAMEPEMESGAIVIRPSRKGTDHLTVSWKVDDGIIQHIDVLEREKTNSFSLGRLLQIGNEEFEDLDEIVARHVQPMASLVRDIMTYRYYRDSNGGDRAILTSLLRKEKPINPDRIPYFLSTNKDHPGYFILAYMPNQRPHFELFSVCPEGFRFRRLIFPVLDRMVTWFKEHYNDAAGGSYYQERDISKSSPQVPRTPQLAGFPNNSSTLKFQYTPVR